MALAIIQLINAALSIWVSEEKMKYIEENKSLEAKYYAEINKPVAPDEESYKNDFRSYRNNAVLDDIEFQLRNLSLALSASITATSSGNQPAAGKPSV
jgi:hypothetical protein